jgi:hypothetical protein
MNLRFGKINKLKVLHMTNLLICIIPTIIHPSFFENCYAQLFGRYLKHGMFEMMELFYAVFGFLLLDILRMGIKNWAFGFGEAMPVE